MKRLILTKIKQRRSQYYRQAGDDRKHRMKHPILTLCLRVAVIVCDIKLVNFFGNVLYKTYFDLDRSDNDDRWYIANQINNAQYDAEEHNDRYGKYDEIIKSLANLKSYIYWRGRGAPKRL